MHEPFFPMGATTGIGSLPLTEAQEAVEFVAHLCPTIPFWPQLPRRSRHEGMLEQGLGMVGEWVEVRPGAYGYDVKPGALEPFLARLQNAPAAFDPVQASGFFAFIEAGAAGRFAHARAIKGHIVGPITLACALFDHGCPVITFSEALPALAATIARRAEWQVARLRQFDKPVILFVDEPGLCVLPRLGHAVDTPGVIEALRQVLITIRHAGAVAGVHCCGPCSWSVIRQIQPDIFAFDAAQTLAQGAADTEARAYVQAGGQLAFGLIPTQGHIDPPTALFQQWYTAASQLGEVSDVARRSLITAACGLAGLAVDRARQSFVLATRLAALVAQVARGDTASPLPNWQG